MRIAPIFNALCLLLALAGIACADAELAPQYHLHGDRSYWSPDHTLRAIVVYLPARGYEWPASVVKLRAASGRLLSSRNYSFGRGSSGHSVTKARWTPDSRFFVFSTENSGGHSPWHSPTHFYSRRRQKFYGLDDFIQGQAITSPDFRIQSPAIVWVSGRQNTVRINLRRLETKLTRTSEKTEYDNY